MPLLDNYFEQIAPIWTAFKQGKIGSYERDNMLAPYRRELAQDREAKLIAERERFEVNWRR